VIAPQQLIRETIEANNPWQDAWELEHLIQFVQQEASVVDTVLEIGTNMGGSGRVWRDVFDPAKIVTVDMKEHDEGDFTGLETVFGLRSQDAECKQRVKQLLEGRTVDFLFIDGGHSYWDCWTDYEMYGSLCRVGAVVAFHDIGAGISSSAKGCHVAMVWDELVRKGGKTAAWRKSLGTGAKVVQ
jgi:predicted O-methyltransferase YrrM